MNLASFENSDKQVVKLWALTGKTRKYGQAQLLDLWGVRLQGPAGHIFNVTVEFKLQQN